MDSAFGQHSRRLPGADPRARRPGDLQEGQAAQGVQHLLRGEPGQELLHTRVERAEDLLARLAWGSAWGVLASSAAVFKSG